MTANTSNTQKQKCLFGSGARVRLSVGEQIEGRVRCEHCGRILRVRVATALGEATLPHHNEPNR